MRELILIFSYIISAFIPALFFKKSRYGFTLGLFWATWLIGLTGAFAGGMFGSMLFAHFGFFPGFSGSILPGLAGAWFVSILFIRLKEMPGNW